MKIARTTRAKVKDYFAYNKIPNKFVSDSNQAIEDELLLKVRENYKNSRPTGINPKIQRGLDVVFSTGIGALAIIPSSLSALILKIKNPKDPILYWQRRIGRYGKMINVPKLRTIKDGKTSQFTDTMRKFGIDETPQLFSVLKGDMSMVGPRVRTPQALIKEYTLEEIVKLGELKPGFGFGLGKGRKITEKAKNMEQKIVSEGVSVKNYFKVIGNLVKTIALGNNK